MTGSRDETALRAAVAANPADADAQLALAAALLARGEIETALAGFSLAGMLAPSAAALRGEVRALCLLGRFTAALSRLEAGGDTLPGAERIAFAHDARHGAALALLRDGQRQEGLQALRALVAAAPGDVGARLNLAAMLVAEGDHRTPAALLSGLDQSQAGLTVEQLARLAALLIEVGAAEPAEHAARRALALIPAMADSWVVLGVALHQQGRLDAALDAYDKALALVPRHFAARCSAAMAHLARGDLARGFAAFEWRRATAGEDPPPLPAMAALAGRQVVLAGEQGHGDTIQFVRYAPLLAARGATVALWAQPGLVRLLSGMVGVAAVAPQDGPAPAGDVHLPLASLPVLFGTTLATVPGAVPYLAAAPAAVAAWRARLAALPGCKVGLVWAGDPRGSAHDRSWDARRSLPLAAMAPLAAVAGISLVSLQKGHGAGQAPPAGLALADWTQELHDFADTAALMTALDLVVTVDSAPVHLAGALGRPVWLLNRFDSDWRWLRDRDDSPWYPTLRQFRQAAPGDWAGVIARVADALAVRVRRT